tara:strand:- start:14097 stop:14285 length:189 start_codon:yes stop_codon:yes gene_type:complete
MRHKIRNLFRRIRLTSNERKLLQIGLQVTEEYINSRKFRRKIKDTLSYEALVEILGNWDDKN